MPEKRSVIDDLFHNRADFRQAVKEALEQYEKGGYEPGTTTFTKMIVGGGKLTAQEWNEAKVLIKAEIASIHKEKDERDELADMRRQDQQKDAAEHEAREEYRKEHGKYPEE